MTRPAIRCLLGCVAAAASLATVAADPAAALAPAPRVTSVSPHAGPSAGGLRVTVGGSGFVGHPSVTFGAAAGTSVRVLSGTKLEVTAPKHAASAINVRVRTAGGTSATSGASEFTYVSPPAISSVSPTASSPDGGGPVTVRGYHFTGAARVRFGAVYATGVHVVSRNEVRATVPAHPADDVGVRVYDVGGVSDPQPFTYGGAPAPVTHLSVVDETPATATLSWTPSATTYVSRVVIVRSAGRTAPGSPSDGMQRASLTPTTTRFTDTGLTEGADYSYSVFASSTDGPPYSTPASITLATTSNSYPSVPTDVTVRPQATGSTSSPCDGTGFVTDTSALTFSASVSDPDDSDVLARFRFVDLGPVGSTRKVVLDFDDPAARTDDVSGSGVVTTTFDSSTLIDGDLYALDAVADDGQDRSAPSTACRFRFDATSPDPPDVSSSTFTASGPPAHIGDSGTFLVRSHNTVLSTGTQVGVQYFLYSFSSPSSLQRYTGFYTYGGGETAVSIPLTATTFGTNYLYVAAVDRSGRRSQATTYQFYVGG